MVGAKFSPANNADSRSLNAATTGTGTVIAFNDCRQVSWHAVTSGTISGGTIIIEHAPTADYAGTWNELDSISATAADAGSAGFGTYPGPILFVRARISSNITGGGNVTVYLNGLLQ